MVRDSELNYYLHCNLVILALFWSCRSNCHLTVTESVYSDSEVILIVQCETIDAFIDNQTIFYMIERE